MTCKRGPIVILALACLAIPSGIGWASGQQPPRPQQGEAAPDGLSAMELQRWLDAYVSMQAQEFLSLTDAQVPQFLGRLRALQTARRKHLQARNQLLLQLNRLVGPRATGLDEVRVRERLKSLDDLEVQAAVNQRLAYEALDQVLDLRQRARFRLFEDQMERRKLDLLARARRGAAARRGAGR